MKLWILALNLIFITSCSNRINQISEKTKLNTQKMEIQYAYTILYVKDVSKSIEFYERALGFEKKMLTPENDYGEVNSGATTLAFASIELGESNIKNGFIESDTSNKPFGIELAFTTLDVEGTMKKAIDNGAILLEEAITKPWGQKVGYLKDVNGFLLEICTPIVATE